MQKRLALTRNPPKIIPDNGRHRRLRELLYQHLAKTPVVLQDFGRSSLWEAAVLNWHCLQENPKHCEPWQTSKEFQYRIQVNFLRHKASNYEELLAGICEIPLDTRSKFILHGLLKSEVLELIAQRYPEFRLVCKAQAKEHKTKTNKYRLAA